MEYALSRPRTLHAHSMIIASLSCDEALGKVNNVGLTIWSLSGSKTRIDRLSSFISPKPSPDDASATTTSRISYVPLVRLVVVEQPAVSTS
jgi:hypothetical protein